MAEKLNLNTASREELDRIPDIGGDCAERIIEDRNKRGGFRSMDELDQIGGFGREAIQNLEANATA